MLFRVLSFALLMFLQLETSWATEEIPQACQCFDLPSCPRNQLAGKSLCSCVNQAELFCWRRNGSTVCPKPVPYDCDNIGPAGESTRIPQTTEAPQASGTFKVPYKGESNLNCVDVGYCFRSSKQRTTMTITMPSGTAVITVPVGLPTLAAATSQTSEEPVIVFTADARRRMKTGGPVPLVTPSAVPNMRWR